MADSGRRQAFWISYRPVPDETVADFEVFLGKVFNHNAGCFGDADERDGHVVYDVIVCLSARVRVTTAWSEQKWAKAGARGRVCDVRWPELGSSVRHFVDQWVRSVRASICRQRFGSESAIWERLSIIHQADVARSTRPRKRPRGGVGTASSRSFLGHGRGGPERLGRLLRPKLPLEPALGGQVSLPPALPEPLAPSLPVQGVAAPCTGVGSHAGPFAGLDFALSVNWTGADFNLDLSTECECFCFLLFCSVG